MKPADGRYGAWGIGLALTAALPVLAGYTSFGWECAELLGFVGLLACLALAACPVRPRESRPSTLLSLDQHEKLGLIALGATLLHAFSAVASDRTALEYLKPTAPLYQLAGIAAALILLALVLSSLAGARRRLWSSHRGFQATHVIAGCALLVLIAAHVVAADRYTHGLARRALVLVTAGGGLLLLLRRRRGTPSSGAASTSRRLVFGRHSWAVAAVILVTVGALGMLIAARAGGALRQPLAARAQALPLHFDHAKHTAVNCVSCHHNYADGRGFDSCIPCHRSERADLKMGAEARFHGFCLDCHRAPPPQLKKHGPVSGCAACHHWDSTQ